MTFLAADDFLLPDILKKIRVEIETTLWDIIWVGNGFYQYRDRNLEKLGQSVLEEKIYISPNSAANIRRIMENTFYNSMFHYERVEFLRENNIDFYVPYYGDCAGMVQAMTVAKNMLVLNEEGYGLTSNTSQSRGTFYWDGEEHIFEPQWKSIRGMYRKEGYFSFLDARYCAMSILKNEIGNMKSLSKGAICVDKEMNRKEINEEQRFLQIQKVLESPIIQEMVQFYGRLEYEEEILKIAYNLYPKVRESR